MPSYAGPGRGENVIAGNDTHAMTRVGELVALLDEQIASAEKGRFGCVENLMASSSALACEIAETRAFDHQACHLIYIE